MDIEPFKIYIDRLRNGKAQVVNETVSPDFLEVEEEGLQFRKPIEVSGEAYIAEEELVLHLTIKAEALMPCAICNEMTPIEVFLDNFYEVVPLEDIKGAIFDMRSSLREEILLQIPHTIECHMGKCPARKDYSHYLREEEAKETDGFHPFADL